MRQNLWPFSHFPLYVHGDFGEDINACLVIGATSQGERIVINARKYISPLHGAPLGFLAHQAAQDEDVNGLLAKLHQRYRQRSASHKGPELVELRLVIGRWILDPEAANRNEPDQRILVGRYRTRANEQ